MTDLNLELRPEIVEKLKNPTPKSELLTVDEMKKRLQISAEVLALIEAADQKGFYRGIDKAIATDEKALEKFYAASDARVEAARTEERERIIGDIKMHTTSTTADKQMGDGWIKMHLSYHKEYWQSITGGE